MKMIIVRHRARSDGSRSRRGHPRKAYTSGELMRKPVAATLAGAALVAAVPTADLTGGAPLLSTFSSRASSPQAVDAGGSATILTSNSAGPNAAVFTPVLKVTVPTGSVAGLYTGTVTQSVA